MGNRVDQLLEAQDILTVDEDEFMRYDEEMPVEIIDGEIVEMSPVGVKHHLIGGKFFRAFDTYNVEHHLGYVFMDGLICVLDARVSDIRGAQIPDVCFIRKERISLTHDLSRPFRGAPDLAVEVVSPDDDPEVLLKRVRRYLKFGSQQVLVAYPNPEEIHRYFAHTSQVLTYRNGVDEQIDLSDLMPGLQLRLADIFNLEA